MDSVCLGASMYVEMCKCFVSQSIRSNFSTFEFDTDEVVELVGHFFLGCGSYGLEMWQDFSPMSPLPSYTY